MGRGQRHFLHTKNFKWLSQIQGNSIHNCTVFLKFIISLRVCHCNYSPQAPTKSSHATDNICIIFYYWHNSRQTASLFFDKINMLHYDFGLNWHLSYCPSATIQVFVKIPYFNIWYQMVSVEFSLTKNTSDRTMALGSTQPLTEMSTRSISWR